MKLIRTHVRPSSEWRRASGALHVGHGTPFMPIASHPILSNQAHAHDLPPSWYTLYELTKLPAGDLQDRLADGSIHPGIERSDVAGKRRARKKKRLHRPEMGSKPACAM